MTRAVMATGANWLALVQQMDAACARSVILDDARRMQEAGFDGLELPMPHLENQLEALGVSFWSDIAGELAAMGMPVVSIHGPNFPVLTEDLASTCKRMQQYARCARATGANALVIHPTTHTHPHVCTVVPELLKRDIALSIAISDVLEDGPTSLAIENLPTYSLRYLEELMGKLGRANIGVCFDTGHWNVRPEGTIEEAIARFAKRIVHLHLTDNHGLCDEHLPPGRGNVPWDRFFKALPEQVAHGAMMVELGAPVLFQTSDAAEQSHAIHCEASQVARATIERGLGLRRG